MEPLTKTDYDANRVIGDREMAALFEYFGWYETPQVSFAPPPPPPPRPVRHSSATTITTTTTTTSPSSPALAPLHPYTRKRRGPAAKTQNKENDTANKKTKQSKS